MLNADVVSCPQGSARYRWTQTEDKEKSSLDSNIGPPLISSIRKSNSYSPLHKGQERCLGVSIEARDDHVPVVDN